MSEVSVVSLDFAGTIAPKDFIDYFWLTLIPKFYSLKYGVGIEEAYRYVISEYESVSTDDVNWYLPNYWLERFGLIEYRDVMLSMLNDYVTVYSEVPTVLTKLRENGIEIVIVSNTAIEFIDVFFNKYGELRKFFSKVYSCVSHFGIPRKSKEFYLRVIEDLGVKPSNVVHVGDDVVYDFEVPRSLGIKAYLLDRSGKRKSPLTISSLTELLDLVLKK